jgi:hypothetical protein
MVGNLLGGIGTIALQGATGDGGGLLVAFGLLLFVIPVVVGLVTAAGMWKVFAKAGQPGWAAIVPIYNVYILVTEVADRDIVWVLLSLFIPFAIVVPMIDVAEAFGKGTGYGLGLFLLGFVFFPLLGFGDAQYRGASGY